MKKHAPPAPWITPQLLWAVLGVILVGLGLAFAAVYLLGDDYSGMVWVEGGEFIMGSDIEEFPETRPKHRVRVSGFYMDATEVTNAQWKRFIAATGYVTVAERVPTREEYPNALPEKLRAFSIVFTPPLDLTETECQSCLDQHLWGNWFKDVGGANWRFPLGPGQPECKDDHPVVHVAHIDMMAYCEWAKKRLPTEAEWEFAARGGLDQKKYYWGDELRPGGKFMANTWQGRFPQQDLGEDGFKGIAPVKQYPPNAYGLYDMAGNVWEVTGDWYRNDTYKHSEGVNPKGPPSSVDPRPNSREQLLVTRGGSFLCADNYCKRYMAGARHYAATDTGTNHTGFRCVRVPQ